MHSAYHWLYNTKQQAIGLCTSLLLWVQSGHQDLPWEFQLKATIAIMSEQDSLINVGTGAGKTLCMILPCLLAPTTMAVRLQVVQVLTFSRYNIKAIAINEDTPNNIDLWKDIQSGVYSVLIVQPEQLCMTNGHLPCLACLIVEDRQFANEAHFIYTAGLKHYDIPAFQPAWALSGTQPPHIKAAIIKNLLFEESELCTIKLTSNRPNIVYATHPVVGKLLDFCNLDFLVPCPYPAGWILPKTVDMQKKGLIMHYHRSMSKEYLTQVYEDFSNLNGHCRVLHATEGTSMVPTALQRGGQGGHSPTSKAIFLLMYEPWVKTIDLAAVEVDTASDPDHPTVPKLTDRLKKKEHSRVTMIKIIQLEHECLCKLYVSYLRDTAPNAHHFTARWCCNRHPGSGFDWNHFFHGRLLYEDPETLQLGYSTPDNPDREEIILPIRKKRKAGTKTCAMSQHQLLISQLLNWRTTVHSNDSFSSVWPAYFILDDGGIKALSKLHPSNITCPGQVVEALNETQEWKDLWSTSLFRVIQAYDREITEQCDEETAQQKDHQKWTRHEQDFARFMEESAETAERICQEVLRRYAAATAGRS
ncbi:hypothetical protein V8E53_006859 [Lactarius tabidus]